MDQIITGDLIVWLQAKGSLGPVVFAGVFILATLVLFPASVLTMLAGYLYGPLIGSVTTSFSGLVSAVLAFLISRYLAGERMKAWSARYPKAQAINTAVSDDGFRMVLLLRLESILPFIPLSFLLGMSRIRTRQYFLATWFGLLPGTVLYVFIGSLISDVSQLSERGETVSRITGTLTIAGGIVIIITLIMIARRARRILNQKVTVKHRSDVRN